MNVAFKKTLLVCILRQNTDTDIHSPKGLLGTPVQFLIYALI